jgi:hypothetical protein
VLVRNRTGTDDSNSHASFKYVSSVAACQFEIRTAALQPLSP